MSNLIISIQVEYEKGKTPWVDIDLTLPLTKIGIDPSEFNNVFNIPYYAPATAWNVEAGSVGIKSSIEHNITLRDGNVERTPISFNIRGRFDRDEDFWNVEIYVDKHNYSISEEERKLIRRKPRPIHVMKGDGGFL